MIYCKSKNKLFIYKDKKCPFVYSTAYNNSTLGCDTCDLWSTVECSMHIKHIMCHAEIRLEDLDEVTLLIGNVGICVDSLSLEQLLLLKRVYVI